MPDYLHNVKKGSDYNKPHIVFRRSIETSNNFESEKPMETFWRMWYKGNRMKRSCGTNGKNYPIRHMRL